MQGFDRDYFDRDYFDRDYFDRDYWVSHWQQANRTGVGQEIVPNPYLASETSSLTAGTALDAGCGEGAEALWLAARGWRVTAVDISAEVLSRAAERARTVGVEPERVHWVEADLSGWNRARGSTWSPPTTRTPPCRNWRCTNASPTGWRRAAPC